MKTEPKKKTNKLAVKHLFYACYFFCKRVNRNFYEKINIYIVEMWEREQVNQKKKNRQSKRLSQKNKKNK